MPSKTKSFSRTLASERYIQKSILEGQIADQKGFDVSVLQHSGITQISSPHLYLPPLSLSLSRVPPHAVAVRQHLHLPRTLPSEWKSWPSLASSCEQRAFFLDREKTKKINVS